MLSPGILMQEEPDQGILRTRFKDAWLAIKNDTTRPMAEKLKLLDEAEKNYEDFLKSLQLNKVEIQALKQIVKEEVRLLITNTTVVQEKYPEVEDFAKPETEQQARSLISDLSKKIDPIIAAITANVAGGPFCIFQLLEETMQSTRIKMADAIKTHINKVIAKVDVNNAVKNSHKVAVLYFSLVSLGRANNESVILAKDKFTDFSQPTSFIGKFQLWKPVKRLKPIATTGDVELVIKTVKAWREKIGTPKLNLTPG